MASIMVASAFGAMGLSATKANAAGETLALISSNYSPTPGQQYTLSGILRDSAGNPMANKPIEIHYIAPGETTWHYSFTVWTGADGKYSTTNWSSETEYLTAGYVENGANVWSPNVLITVS